MQDGKWFSYAPVFLPSIRDAAPPELNMRAWFEESAELA